MIALLGLILEGWGTVRFQKQSYGLFYMACDKRISSVMVETYSFDAINLLDERSSEGEYFKELVAKNCKLQGKF